MKKLWKCISPGKRLTLDIAAVLLFLFLIWAILGYPAFTAKQAFRRGLKNAAYPDAELALLLETQKNADYVCGIGGNDNFAYSVALHRENGWKPVRVDSCVSQVAQELWCVRIPWSLHYSRHTDDSGFYHYWIDTYSYSEPLYNASTGEALIVPCFAVKAPGSTASLTLVLEEGDYLDPYTGETLHSVRTEWPLLLQEARNGWFVFQFDTKQIAEALQEEDPRNSILYDDPYHSYFTWISQYPPDSRSPESCPPAHLELCTYDEANAPLRTESWPLVSQ